MSDFNIPTARSYYLVLLGSLYALELSFLPFGFSFITSYMFGVSLFPIALALLPRRYAILLIGLDMCFMLQGFLESGLSFLSVINLWHVLSSIPFFIAFMVLNARWTITRSYLVAGLLAGIINNYVGEQLLFPLLGAFASSFFPQPKSLVSTVVVVQSNSNHTQIWNHLPFLLMSYGVGVLISAAIVASSIFLPYLFLKRLEPRLYATVPELRGAKQKVL